MTEHYDYIENKTFNGMDEFAEWLSTTGLFVLDERIAMFYDAYNGINKGCSCGKKKRMARAEATYKDLVNMNDESKMVIRDACNTNKVTLKIGDQVVFSH